MDGFILVSSVLGVGFIFIFKVLVELMGLNIEIVEDQLVVFEILSGYVFIVEDFEINVMVVKKMFDCLDFIYEYVLDGVVVVEVVFECDFDVVLMDVLMLNLDGLEVI